MNSPENREIPKEDSRKPDPSEPWRYVSPCCNQQIRGDERTMRYRCNGCGRMMDASELIDKKVRINE